MTQVSADFETGVNAATIATTDPGSATAFDVVTRSANGISIYDNTHVSHGSLAGSFGANGAGGANAYITWTAIGTVTDHYGRCYLYLPQYEVGLMPIIQVLSGATRAARIDYSATGKLGGFDNPGAAAFTTFTNAITLNQWVRIEWHIVHSATVGQVEVKLFNTADSATPTEVQTGPANKNTLASADRIQLGAGVGAAANMTTSHVLWMDDMVAGATSYPGPIAAASTSSLALAGSGEAFLRMKGLL